MLKGSLMLASGAIGFGPPKLTAAINASVNSTSAAAIMIDTVFIEAFAGCFFALRHQS